MIHEFLIDITRQQGTVREREGERERETPRVHPLWGGAVPKCCRISSVGNGLTMCLAQGAVAGVDPSPAAVCRTWVSLNRQPKTRTHQHTHKRLNALSAGPGWLAGYPSTTDYFGLICHISASVQNQNSIYAQTQAHKHTRCQADTPTAHTCTNTHTHTRTLIQARTGAAACCRACVF